MSEKKRQNSASVLQKTNHLGMALFVFVVLAGTILWLTGNLHLGPRGATEAGSALDDGHGHEHGQQVNELVCE